MSLNLYLATLNPAKLREFQEGSRGTDLAIQSLPGIDRLPACAEDGATFEQNACKKALLYSQFTSELVFADDSGICSAALDGAPGVHSARYAGPGATDDQNNEKLLTEIRQARGWGSEPPSSETALKNLALRYVCVIALAAKGKLLAIVEGHADGVVCDPPCGAGGFGYDPLFFYPPLGRTFAQLSLQEKFKVSHRGEAFRKILAFLASPSFRML